MATLTYSPAAQGWPSFYSYEPEYIVGMNNHLYTWKSGRLYRHDTGDGRNNFYNAPNAYPTEVTTVFNDAPLSNLLWKTIHLESIDVWDVEMTTDIQVGFVDKEWLTKKESAWFAFVRNRTLVDPSSFSLRSSIGVGTISEVNPGNIVFNFNVGTMLHQGDLLYALENGAIVGPVGYVTLVTYDQANNTTTVEYTTAGVDNPITPIAGYFIVYQKDVVAESTGVLGHYNVVKLTNESTLPVELFAVETEVMPSFPYP